MSQLECIFDVEKDTKVNDKYRQIFKNLKEKYGKGEYKNLDIHDLVEEVKCKPQYARTVYTGKLKEGINISELELSMVCDGGYSHFGGSSIIRSDRTFEVNIYTD